MRLLLVLHCLATAAGWYSRNHETATLPVAAAASPADSSSSSPTSSWLDDYHPPDDHGRNAIYGTNKEEDEIFNGSDEDSLLLSSFQTHPLLQIPCRLNGIALKCYCDTGAQRSVLSWQAAERCGLLIHVDRRHAGHAVGVAAPCRVVGRLPHGVTQLQFDSESTKMESPALTVLEQGSMHNHVDLLLGLDFLREHQAILDLRDEELEFVLASSQNGDVTVRVPFIRPRQRASIDGASTDRDSCRLLHVCSPPSFVDEEESDIGEEGERIDMSGI